MAHPQQQYTLQGYPITRKGLESLPLSLTKKVSPDLHPAPDPCLETWDSEGPMRLVYPGDLKSETTQLRAWHIVNTDDFPLAKCGNMY